MNLNLKAYFTNFLLVLFMGALFPAMAMALGGTTPVSASINCSDVIQQFAPSYSLPANTSTTTSKPFGGTYWYLTYNTAPASKQYSLASGSITADNQYHPLNCRVKISGSTYSIDVYAKSGPTRTPSCPASGSKFNCCSVLDGCQ